MFCKGPRLILAISLAIYLSDLFVYMNFPMKRHDRLDDNGALGTRSIYIVIFLFFHIAEASTILALQCHHFYFVHCYIIMTPLEEVTYSCRIYI